MKLVLQAVATLAVLTTASQASAQANGVFIPQIWRGYPPGTVINGQTPSNTGVLTAKVEYTTDPNYRCDTLVIEVGNEYVVSDPNDPKYGQTLWQTETGQSYSVQPVNGNIPTPVTHSFTGLQSGRGYKIRATATFVGVPANPPRPRGSPALPSTSAEAVSVSHTAP